MGTHWKHFRYTDKTLDVFLDFIGRLSCILVQNDTFLALEGASVINVELQEKYILFYLEFLWKYNNTK